MLICSEILQNAENLFKIPPHLANETLQGAALASGCSMNLETITDVWLKIYNRVCIADLRNSE